MSIIYCDESGNSGEKLLDKDQPFFVLASNDFSRSEALNLLNHLHSHQQGEAKFKTLKRTADGVKRLTKLFVYPRLNETRIVVDTYHKRFMVVAKMVDLIAETLMHESGVDLYQHGQNIAMSNMLYYCMPTFCGDEPTENFLQSFIDLLRNRTTAHADAFFMAGKAMIDASNMDDFKQLLRPFTEPKTFNVWFDGINSMALEPAIPALFQHINEWGKRKQDRFSIVHDASKPVLAAQKAFESMMALNGETSGMVGYDRRKFNFPLRATSLEQGNSVEYPQIQLADLCAGAINYFLKCNEKGELDCLATVIRDQCCQNWVINGVFPDVSVTPEEMNTNSDDGVNPINSILDYIHSKKNN
ncbi:MAG: DUF3800 domain-containing protein [Acidithiobacillus sp.]|nr:DUF3800 domain-containing protein [Acidithiobacillus sp.]